MCVNSSETEKRERWTQIVTWLARHGAWKKLFAWHTFYSTGLLGLDKAPSQTTQKTDDRIVCRETFSVLASQHGSGARGSCWGGGWEGCPVEWLQFIQQLLLLLLAARTAGTGHQSPGVGTRCPCFWCTGLLLLEAAVTWSCEARSSQAASFSCSHSLKPRSEVCQERQQGREIFWCRSVFLSSPLQCRASSATHALTLLTLQRYSKRISSNNFFT